MSLQDIALKTEYRSFQDDIAQDFYIPALKQAVRYKKGSGLFLFIHFVNDNSRLV